MISLTACFPTNANAGVKTPEHRIEAFAEVEILSRYNMNEGSSEWSLCRSMDSVCEYRVQWQAYTRRARLSSDAIRPFIVCHPECHPQFELSSIVSMEHLGDVNTESP